MPSTIQFVSLVSQAQAVKTETKAATSQAQTFSIRSLASK